MKSIVFAAGIGSRLKPFTDKHPKALAPIAGRAVLGLVIDKLIAAGADAIVVNVHHFANQIVDFLATQHYPIPIEISDESNCLLDTGGGITKIFRESQSLAELAEDEPIIVHNADILTDFPIEEMLRFSCSTSADAAIFVDPMRETSRKFLLDADGCLQGWMNKSTAALKPEGLDATILREAAFNGVHILTRDLLEDISSFCGELHPFSITDYYIARCRERNIRAYVPSVSFRWFDIGTPERLAAAQSFVK